SCALDSVTTQVSCTTQQDQVGTSNVVFSVTDGSSVEYETMRVNVTAPIDPNQAPVLQPLPNQVLDKNSGLNSQLIDLTQYASDADNDPLTFTIVGQTNPSVVDCIIEQNRYISCDVEPNVIGNSQVTVRVSDGQLFAQRTFS